MRYIYLSIALTLLLVTWSASNVMWGGNHSAGIIKVDGKGYYAHLPAIFIYDDLHFNFYDSIENGKYYNVNFEYDYRRQTPEGKTYNKYYCGTAIPMMPFFLVAHAIAKNSDKYPADGYSKPYQISVSVAAIFYMLASLWLMALILLHFKISERVIAFCIPVIVFGTNWYYYILNEPAFSHSFSIFFITAFVYLGLKWGRTGKLNIVLYGVLVGLIILIRPLNGVVIALVPFFFTSFKAFWKAFLNLFKNPLRLTIGMVLGLAVLSIQLWIYKEQTGSFYIYSYEEEGFNFLQPEIFNILLSYKKGLFIYTPLTLVCLLGLYKMGKKHTYQTIYLALFLALFTYLVSSWWCWYYGGSFSSRVYIDYFALFLIPLAFLLNNFKQAWLKKLTFSIVILLTLFCQFQTYQYRRMIIHWDSMNQEKYWEVFLDMSVFKR